MKPSTLAALLAGDLENAIISETPSGIEAQGARGQKDFVADETLPIKCNFCKRGELEEMGIVFGDPVDDLFVEVQLPEGWEKVPTSHSMWSELVDEKGRKRASIFYKAAFYDRDAFIGTTLRFSRSVDPVCGWGEPDYKKHEWHCVVTDCGEVVWASDKRVEPEPEYPRPFTEEHRLAWLAWSDRKDALSKLGDGWLASHYPDWQDPSAYWG